MDNLIGKSLSHYHILEQLGKGGMATVYKAYDDHLEREVAVKIIRREAFPPEQLDHLLKRFEREAKALAQLVHPNIVNVIDYGSQEGNPYLVMNYLPGGSLKDKLGKPMPWLEAARLLLPVARALQFTHAQGIIHRDVKPANILLTESGEPMLTDFGIAKLLESGDAQTLTGTGIGIGTPEYMAPEQWTGKVSPQTDIYALGVVFFELLTDRKPYTADTPAEILLKQANEPLPRPSTYIPDLPHEVEQILERAMAKSPAERFASMEAFALALEGLLGRRTETHPAPLKPAEIETAGIEKTHPGRMPETAATIRTSASGRPIQSRPAFSWKLWGPVALVVILIGIGLGVGPRLFNLPKQAAGKTAIPMNILPISTSMPSLAPSPTSTPLPTETPTPLPTATATPWLRLGQSLASKSVGYGFMIKGFSIDGQTIVSISRRPSGGTVIFTWNLKTLDRLSSKDLLLPKEASNAISGALSSDERVGAAGFADGSVALFSQDNGSIKLIQNPNAQPVVIVFSIDNQILAVAYTDKSVHLYKLPDGILLQTFQLPSGTGRVNIMGFSPDGQILAVSSDDWRVRLFRVLDGSLLQSLQFAGGPLKCFEFQSCFIFSPDGQTLAISAADNSVHLWKVADGSPLATLTGSNRSVVSMAFSPDGKSMAAGSEDNIVRVWQLSDGSLLDIFKGHTARVISVAFAPYDPILLSASEDGTLRAWGLLP